MCQDGSDFADHRGGSASIRSAGWDFDDDAAGGIPSPGRSKRGYVGTLRGRELGAASAHEDVQRVVAFAHGDRVA
jgi:hypothetical protein